MDRHGLFKRESECCACLEKKPRTVAISNDTICHECLHYMFQKALNHEAEYPAKWGSKVLNPKDYYHKGVVSQSFIREYQEKQKEYHCPPARRVYCSWTTTPAYQGKGKDKSNDQICQSFLGKSIQNPDDVVRNGGNDTITVCRKCHRPSCLACGDRILVNTPHNPHKCIPLNAVDTEGAAFEGLKRGKDYQICPSERCGRRLKLRDGCSKCNPFHTRKKHLYSLDHRRNDIDQNGYYIPDPGLFNRDPGNDHYIMDAEERDRLLRHMARWDRRAFDRGRAERALNPSPEREQIPEERDAAVEAPGNNPGNDAGENAVETGRRAALRRRLGALRDRLRRFTRRF
jgi:hypothetical protein